LADNPFKIAAVQASSVYLDLSATIDKACALIEEAAKGGATLAAFPEAFVPGYPLWVWFIPPGHTHPLRAAFTELHRNSIAIPWVSSMRHIAKEGRCFVVSACQAFHKDQIPDSLEFKGKYLEGVEGWINPGLSLIVDPDGKIVSGPLEEEEGILYAGVEPHQLIGPRWQLRCCRALCATGHFRADGPPPAPAVHAS
jgi:predicted amidohydrolase